MSEGIRLDHERAVFAVVKGNPTKVRFGAANTPMPAGFRQNGQYVTIRQSGWASLDNREYIASGWVDGSVGVQPELTLTGCDTSGETGTNPPNVASAIIGMRSHLANYLRYPKP